jgi:glyoxylase-like metal-dependent hydrolase (beta-lactamase superfamily II)
LAHFHRGRPRPLRAQSVQRDDRLNQQRSLAVIAETKRTFPNKPIRYLVNTHNHFDHLGGVRTYVAEGATVITDDRTSTPIFTARRQRAGISRMSARTPLRCSGTFSG